MRQTGLVTGAALGALLGGAAALVLAPKSGKENLQALKSGMGNVRRRTMRMMRRRKEQAQTDPADAGKEDYLF